MSKVFHLILFLAVFISIIGLAQGFNNPGHDSLYIDRTGDDVNGTFNFTGTFYVPPPGSPMEAATRQYVDDNAGSGNLWTNTSGNATFTTGNVGIGTSSPEYLLDIRGGVSNNRFLNIKGDVQDTGGPSIGSNFVFDLNDASVSDQFRAQNVEANIESDVTGSVVVSDIGASLANGVSIPSLTMNRISPFYLNLGSAPKVDSVRGIDIGSFRAGDVADFADRAAGINIRTIGGQTTFGETALLIGTSSIPDGDFSIYSDYDRPSFFNGSIGIGTSSPNRALDVSGDVRASTSLQTGDYRLHNSNGLYRDNSNMAGVRIGAQVGGGARPLIFESGDGGSYTDGRIDFDIDGTTRAEITDEGVSVDGGLQLDTSDTRPTCNSDRRGMFWFEQASSGNDDVIWSCMKNSSEAYNWIMVARGG